MMALLTWIAFLVSTILLVVVSRKSVWLALLMAAVVLSLLTAPLNFGLIFLLPIIDLDVIFLATGMVLIPIIGAVMEESGMLNAMVRGPGVHKAIFSATAPALVGLLPVPGGALISAPMVKEAINEDMAPEKQCAMNVWFRHLLFLVYPASAAMIISADLAGLNLYICILFLTPFFGITFVGGWFTFLRPLKGRLEKSPVTRRRIIQAFLVLMATPVIDLVLRLSFPLFGIELMNLSLVIAVSTSTALAVAWSRIEPRAILKLVWKTGPWNYFLFIIFMYSYLHAFDGSGLGGIIASFALPPVLLLGLVGFALGFITGRVQVPEAIIIPVYLQMNNLAVMGPLAFACGFFSIYLGYVISPVHPCLSVTLEYYNVSYGATVKQMILPCLILFGTVLAIMLFI